MSQVGDLDSGKAWRTVRRPSDMASGPVHMISFCLYLLSLFNRTSIPAKSSNFVLKRNQERHTEKYSSKVSRDIYTSELDLTFKIVLRMKGLNVPLPHQQTLFTLTLNNGIHFVTTPENVLTLDAKIEQEFEL